MSRSETHRTERGHSCPRICEGGQECPPSGVESVGGQECPPSGFYDGSFSAPVLRYRHVLPHWESPGLWVFVTWHLGDSLPSEKLAKLRREKEAWEIFHPKPWDEVLEREYHDLFSRQVDAWLDQGMGECLLRDTRAAEVVADVLMHDQDRLYEIDCCAIMPNHVHVLVRFLSDEGQSLVLKSWKGISARRINAILGRKGEFWMEGYWDRFIRNERHFETTRKYILENPRKAGLHKGYLLYSKEYARG